MTGVFFFEAQGLDQAVARLNALTNPTLATEALAQVGGVLESQTRQRFIDKVDPEGKAWAPWSERYAASRRRGHSLLIAEGHLLDSIQWSIEGGELFLGSNLVYAAIDQFGGEEGMHPGPAAIPARAYVGLSDANEHELLEALEAWIGGVLQ